MVKGHNRNVLPVIPRLVVGREVVAGFSRGVVQAGVAEGRVAVRERQDIRVRGMDRRGGDDLASSFSCIIRLGGFVFGFVLGLRVMSCAAGNEKTQFGTNSTLGFGILYSTLLKQIQQLSRLLPLLSSITYLTRVVTTIKNIVIHHLSL